MSIPQHVMQGRYVVMGVSGCGKTTIGKALAARLGLTFFDGDALHTVENIAKMSQGVPLDDTDRIPWLIRVGKQLVPGTVVACSALKQSYRDLIRKNAGGPVTFLYLRGRPETLADRMHHRDGHFMPPELLESQLTTLEEPAGEKLVVIADIENTCEDILDILIAGMAD